MALAVPAFRNFADYSVDQSSREGRKKKTPG
jgi:hypothetical protein